MRVLIQSFGHKHGSPPEADLVLDTRSLPNPYSRNELRHLSGKDAAVVLWLQEKDAVKEFLQTAYLLMTQGISGIKAGNEGQYVYRVAIGCTGGRHRSVCMAEVLGGMATLDHSMYRHSITVEHRDIDHSDKPRRTADGFGTI